ncbi:MAG: PH domain-containing protein, partial [Alphaproteobacteria bacterium]
MGSYVRSNLIAGEEVVYETGLHPIIYLSPAALIFGGIVLGTVINPSIGAVLLGFGVLSLAGAWLRQWAGEFAVTNRRVIVKLGFISRRTIEINLSKVESVEV